jgi:DNA-directed RNA polymerase subunit omega
MKPRRRRPERCRLRNGGTVLDVDIEDQLVEKTGGKLQLTSLMQKRLVELKRGARPLVVTDSLDLLDIVVQEILQGKVELGELEVTEANFLDDARKLKDGDSDEEKGVYGSDLKKVKEERIKELSEFLNPTKE